MEKNNEIFNETVGSLFKGMDSFLHQDGSRGGHSYRGHDHSSPGGCNLRCRGRRFPQHGFQKEQQRRRYGRKDASQRGSDHSQWHNPHGSAWTTTAVSRRSWI